MSKSRFGVGVVGTSPTTIVSGADVIRAIDAASVVNTSAMPATLDVYIVPSGGGASTANQVYSDLAVSANTTIVLSAMVNEALAPGDTVEATASTGATLTMRVSGRSA